MNTNMKIIAIALACAQMFACATDGYKVDTDTVKNSRIYHLKAIGKQTEWQEGELVAVSNNSNMNIKVSFLETGATGLVFDFSVENLSQSQFDVLSSDIFCRQNNIGEPLIKHPILSEFEALANYSKMINNIYYPQTQKPSDGAELLGFFIFIFALFAIFHDATNDDHHSQHSHPSHNSHHSHHSHEKRFPDHDLVDALVNIDLHSDDATTSDNQQELTRRIAARQQQQKEKMFKSQTLYPGQRASGQIYCPFEAVNDDGISVVYNDEQFVFAE